MMRKKCGTKMNKSNLCKVMSIISVLYMVKLPIINQLSKVKITNSFTACIVKPSITSLWISGKQNKVVLAIYETVTS
jgi:hypothetical protein